MVIRPLAFVLLLGALSDETRKVEAVCPVDGTKFTATEVVRSDARWAWGGWDPDFCAHAYKTAPMEHYVWTCPKCFFSGGKDDYDPGRRPTEELKAALAGALKPALLIRPGMRQEEIPGWVKYDLVGQICVLWKKPPADAAKKFLHASWAARTSGAAWLDNLDEWAELRQSLGFERTPMELGKENRTDLDLRICAKIEKEVSGREVKSTDVLLRKYALAYAYRKHGENVAALKWIEELGRARGFNSVVDDACVRMKASIEAERACQAKAAEWYRKALEGAEPGPKGEYLFQLGEIARRNGDLKAAAGWFAKSLETNPDEAFRKRIEAQRKAAE